MRINSVEELIALYGEVNPNSLRKEAPSLTAAYRRWIDQSPFMAVATNGPGGLDCSPRGDAVGQLVRIADENTILFPDRRGNNRLDTLRNLVVDPRISLLFLIPGVQECMRVNGTATVSTDPDLVRLFDVDGKLPVTVVSVTIGSVYFQCGRAIIRSGLWIQHNVGLSDDVPTAGEMTRSVDATFDAGPYDAALGERQRGSLY
jgi:uncharacterized protein